MVYSVSKGIGVGCIEAQIKDHASICGVMGTAKYLQLGLYKAVIFPGSLI